MADLKDKVKEFADIAASLPEKLQQPCFELLLKHYLSDLAPKAPLRSNLGAQVDAETTLERPPGETTPADATKRQADLTTSDLHVKMRRFMEKYSISLIELNNLFYKEGEAILPLYEDLKTTRMSEAQTRVALLQSLLNALLMGEFQANVESIRNECRDRKCYDSTNFSANFNNNKSLYDFEKYTKVITDIKLSDDGKKELSQLIKELQS